MKLFQQLLLAPAALGLLAPMSAMAADLNLGAVNKYAGPEEQVTSITQFSDVSPTSWAYQALSNLVERYGCVAGYPNGTFKGKQALTRWEAAALLNACLDRITEVTDELKKLMKEFQKELAVLRGRVDGLEAKVGELEANQFSTTTKLKGVATFVMGSNTFGGSNAFAAGKLRALEGATTFNYDLRLNLDTSFTGKDLLRSTLRAGNFGQSAWNGGLNQMEVAFQENNNTIVGGSPNVVEINRLFYQFPIGSQFTATVGGRVRQDDMLALWPSAYPADTILDVFTYAGAPGTYSLNLGSGAGLWWKQGGFSVSANYVAANGNVGSPAATTRTVGSTTVTVPGGGIGNAASQQTFTAQIGYAGTNWGTAVAYNYSTGLGPAVGTPLVTSLVGVFPSSKTNSVGISGYWSPSTSGWVPSISAGWGITGYTSNGIAGPGTINLGGAQSQSWYTGLQWSDVFIKGNAAGFAVGQAPFVTKTAKSIGGTPNDSNYNFEWWYKFQVTDNISVTPAIFYISQFLGQGGKNAPGGGTSSVNNFGGLIKTTFKF
ncbi:MAG: iron uptake porin [Synechococcaceae cyanobacterium ELA445]